MKDKLQRIVRLPMHPIWHYSIPEILLAVKNDWEGPIGANARSILSSMKEHQTTAIEISFLDEITNKPFLVMRCEIDVPDEPNDQADPQKRIEA